MKKLFIVLFILLLSTPVYCNTGNIILIVYEGGYSLTPKETINNTPLYNDIDLVDYDKIETFKNSKIELKFKNGLSIRLQGNSSLEIIPHGFFFHSGSIFVNNSNSRNKILIRTKFMDIHSSESIFSLLSDKHNPPGNIFVDVFDGVIEITDSLKSHCLIMEKGYAVTNDDDYRLLYFNVFPINILSKIRNWKKS